MAPQREGKPMTKLLPKNEPGRQRDFDWCCWCHVDTNANPAECTFSETGFYCKENEANDR